MRIGRSVGKDGEGSAGTRSGDLPFEYGHRNSLINEPSDYLCLNNQVFISPTNALDIKALMCLTLLQSERERSIDERTCCETVSEIITLTRL